MSEPNPTLPKPPPDPIDFQPEPQVVRFNRRAIGLLAGALTAAILAAVFTLSERSRQADVRAGRVGARAEAAPERFWDSAPNGVARPADEGGGDPLVEESREDVPVLEPEGPIGLYGTSDAGAPSGDPAERALRSPIVAYHREEAGTSNGVPRADLSGRFNADSTDGSGAPVFDPASLGSLGQPEDPTLVQNLQREKQTFLQRAATDAGAEVSSHRVRAASSPYIVLAGSLIPAVLITGARSDLPGQLIAQVRENVFDSPTGAHLLLPQGTRALGVYDSVVAFGQDRVLVAWQRLIFPDGSSLTLEAMPGVDESGQAGFADRANRHFLQTFGGALLLSAISAGTQLSQGTFSGGDGNGGSTDPREVIAAALGQNLGELGTEMARRNLNIQPSLEIRAGYRFHIAVVKDVVLPGPYRGL